MPEVRDAEERGAYAGKIEIGDLKGEEHTIKVGGSAQFFSRVSGEVRNRGNRTLGELAVKVYYLDPKGEPHFEDVAANQTRRATFNVVYPVLANSAHPGEHARPLRPGERRRFAVDVPLTFDGPENVQPEKFGAAVLHLQFSAD